MIPANTYQDICEVLTYDFKYNQQNLKHLVRMVGILFVRPGSSVANSEIIPNLGYFHTRAGKHIHFFCAGYGAYWPSDWVPDKVTIAKIGGIDWEFSSDTFVSIVKEFEERTKWHYSGGADLLLTNAHYNPNREEAFLDFSSTITCNIDKMKKDETILSVETFFEDIFRYAENQLDNDPTWGFGDQQSIAVSGSALIRLVLSLIPKGVGKDVAKLSHYWLKDVSNAI